VRWPKSPGTTQQFCPNCEQQPDTTIAVMTYYNPVPACNLGSIYFSQNRGFFGTFSEPVGEGE